MIFKSEDVSPIKTMVIFQSHVSFQGGVSFKIPNAASLEILTHLCTWMLEIDQ